MLHCDGLVTALSAYRDSTVETPGVVLVGRNQQRHGEVLEVSRDLTLQVAHKVLQTNVGLT